MTRPTLVIAVGEMGQKAVGHLEGSLPWPLSAMDVQAHLRIGFRGAEQLYVVGNGGPVELFDRLSLGRLASVIMGWARLLFSRERANGARLHGLDVDRSRFHVYVVSGLDRDVAANLLLDLCYVLRSVLNKVTPDRGVGRLALLLGLPDSAAEPLQAAAGYSVLKELNNFTHLTGYELPHGEVARGRPFDVCWLLSRANEGGYPADLDAQASIIGEALRLFITTEADANVGIPDLLPEMVNGHVAAYGSLGIATLELPAGSFQDYWCLRFAQRFWLEEVLAFRDGGNEPQVEAGTFLATGNLTPTLYRHLIREEDVGRLIAAPPASTLQPATVAAEVDYRLAETIAMIPTTWLPQWQTGSQAALNVATTNVNEKISELVKSSGRSLPFARLFADRIQEPIDGMAQVFQQERNYRLDLVRRLRDALASHGHPCAEAEEFSGRLTEQVAAFQRSQGLDVPAGIVESETWEALGEPDPLPPLVEGGNSACALRGIERWRRGRALQSHVDEWRDLLEAWYWPRIMANVQVGVLLLVGFSFLPWLVFALVVPRFIETGAVAGFSWAILVLSLFVACVFVAHTIAHFSVLRLRTRDYLGGIFSRLLYYLLLTGLALAGLIAAFAFGAPSPAVAHASRLGLSAIVAVLAIYAAIQLVAARLRHIEFPWYEWCKGSLTKMVHWTVAFLALAYLFLPHVVDNLSLPLASNALRGKVYLDANNNAVLDPGEPGVPNTAITVRSERGISVARTDGDGRFKVGGLVAGSYRVEVSPPTALDSGQNAAGSLELRLLEGREQEIAVGVRRRPGLDGRISGLAFRDANANGVYDDGEAGVSGMRVWVLDRSGDVAASGVTGAGGTFDLGNLASAQYTVVAQAPSRMRATTAPVLRGIRPGSTASARDRAIGLEDAPTPATPPDLFTGWANLGGRVFSDENGNGVADPEERGISSVPVLLEDPKEQRLLAATVTDGGGRFAFSQVLPGEAVIAVELPFGLNGTTRRQVSATPGENPAISLAFRQLHQSVPTTGPVTEVTAGFAAGIAPLLIVFWLARMGVDALFFVLLRNYQRRRVTSEGESYRQETETFLRSLLDFQRAEAARGVVISLSEYVGAMASRLGSLEAKLRVAVENLSHRCTSLHEVLICRQETAAASSCIGARYVDAYYRRLLPQKDEYLCSKELLEGDALQGWQDVEAVDLVERVVGKGRRLFGEAVQSGLAGISVAGEFLDTAQEEEPEQERARLASFVSTYSKLWCGYQRADSPAGPEKAVVAVYHDTPPELVRARLAQETSTEILGTSEPYRMTLFRSIQLVPLWHLLPVRDMERAYRGLEPGDRRKLHGRHPEWEDGMPDISSVNERKELAFNEPVLKWSLAKILEVIEKRDGVGGSVEWFYGEGSRKEFFCDAPFRYLSDAELKEKLSNLVQPLRHEKERQNDSAWLDEIARHSQNDDFFQLPGEQRELLLYLEHLRGQA